MKKKVKEKIRKKNSFHIKNPEMLSLKQNDTQTVL